MIALIYIIYRIIKRNNKNEMIDQFDIETIFYGFTVFIELLIEISIIYHLV